MGQAFLTVLGVALLTCTGCTTLVKATLPYSPAKRTFGAPRDPVWKACLEALEDAPLASVDSHAGIIITDWTQERSDQRFLRRLGRLEALKIRRKFIVRVQATPRGTRVMVQNVEYTAYPDYRYTGTSHSRAYFPKRPFPRPPARYTSHYQPYDRYELTPSSTAREKVYLDRVERLLRARFGS